MYIPFPVRDDCFRALQFSGALIIALATLAMLSGCIRLASQDRSRGVRRPTTVPQPSKQPSETIVTGKSDAFGVFTQLRSDLIDLYPHIKQTNCAFVIGIDVSGSAHSSHVLEYSVDILHDLSRYFLADGDTVMIVPWDSAIRTRRVTEFEYTGAEQALRKLDNAFEDLEGLVDPESRGSNVLDARGYCMAKALKLSGDGKDNLCPVVVILSDTYTADIAPERQQYSVERLKQLRRELAGEDVKFHPHSYETSESAANVKAHLLAAPDRGYQTVGGIDRMRAAQQPKTTTTRPPKPRRPSQPQDTGGWQTLLIVAVLVGLGLLIGLPFAMKHQVVIGEQVEKLRAIGGTIRIEASSGISPPNVVYLPVEGLDERVLATIEASGPQLVVRSRRGVRLNEGRTEFVLPAGRPQTIRFAIDGIPGEQTIQVRAGDFFSNNAPLIAGMILGLLIAIGCIIA